MSDFYLPSDGWMAAAFVAGFFCRRAFNLVWIAVCQLLGVP